MITGGQIRGHQTDFIGQGLDTVAMGADQFKDIRIFFMRHDAAAGGEFCRETDKSKILVQVQTGIHAQLRQSASARPYAEPPECGKQSYAGQLPWRSCRLLREC